MEALQNFVAHRCNARFCPTPCHVALGTATFLCWVRSMRLTNFPDRIRISSTIYLETFSAQRRGVRICTCLLYHPMTQKSSFCHRSLRNVVADVLDPIEKRLHDDVVLSRSCISRPSDLSSASDVHRATPLVRLAFPSSHWKRPRRPLPRREETLQQGRKEGRIPRVVVHRFFPSKSRPSTCQTKVRCRLHDPSATLFLEKHPPFERNR